VNDAPIRQTSEQLEVLFWTQIYNQFDFFRECVRLGKAWFRVDAPEADKDHMTKLK
jgi:hypothetical protein